jgi:hypothetical protein
MNVILMAKLITGIHLIAITNLLIKRWLILYVKDQLGHHSILVFVDISGHLMPGSNRSATDRLLGEKQLATTEGAEEKEKALRKHLSALINLARPRGFEPPTFGFVV